MHEISIAQNIVSVVDEAATGRRVRRVNLEIGDLSGVMSDAIAFCFDLVAAGTSVEGAILDIRRIEGRALCGECGADAAAPTLYAPCPCGSLLRKLVQGDELNIKSIEVEEAC